jgi:hypothetical protein
MVPKAAGNLFFSRADGVDLRGHFLRSVLTMGIAARRCLKPHQSAQNFLSFFDLFAMTLQPEPDLLTGSTFAKPLPCEVGLFSRIICQDVTRSAKPCLSSKS